MRPVVVLLTLYWTQALLGQNILQDTRGPCSPAIAQVTGNVRLDINCPGVPPEVVAKIKEDIGGLGRDVAAMKAQLAEINSAVQSYLQVVNDQALNPEARQFLFAGRFDQARQVVERQISASPPSETNAAARHLQLAMIYNIELDSRQALQHFERAYQLAPGNAGYAVLYALELGLVGRYQDAIKILETVRQPLVAGAPSSGNSRDLINVTVALARAYAGKGDVNTARTLLLDLGDRAVSDTGLQSLSKRTLGLVMGDLAALEWEAGNIDYARRAFGFAEAFFREECARIEIGASLGDCHGLADTAAVAGRFYFTIHELPEAERLLNIAVRLYKALGRVLDVPEDRLSPDALQSQVLLARIFQSSGRSASAAEQAAHALPLVEQAALADSSEWTDAHAWCRFIIGVNAVYEKNYREADSQVRQAVRLWRVVLQARPEERNTAEVQLAFGLSTHATIANLLGDRQATISRASEAANILRPRLGGAEGPETQFVRTVYGQALFVLGSSLVETPDERARGCEVLADLQSVAREQQILLFTGERLAQYCR